MITKKKRLMTALAASVVATSSLAAGTASAAEPVSNGDFIEMFNGDTRIGTCSATVIAPDSILTAGHCGFVGAKVRVRDTEIGTVDSSGLKDGYDILHIALNPGIVVNPGTPNTGYAPAAGDHVAKDGWRSFHTEGTVSDPEIRVDDKSHESINGPGDGQEFTVSTWVASLNSLQGDSGGPVTHDGKIVGLVKGGSTSSATTVTPLGPALAALQS